MRPIPFGHARRLVEVLQYPPPAASVIGAKIDFNSSWVAIGVVEWEMVARS